MASLADSIDELLPQTQCSRCGYPDCHAYAAAIAHGETSINRCPPGGDATIAALAELLQQRVKPLDPAVGTFVQGTVAFIEEPLCIGCTKCIQACPVDAIVGAAKQMHTIIEALCTGCELCLPPCPVDCISLIPAKGTTAGSGSWQFPPAGLTQADALRDRYHSHQSRSVMDRAGRQEHVAQRASASSDDLIIQRKAEIAAAVERVRAKREAQKKT